MKIKFLSTWQERKECLDFEILPMLFIDSCALDWNNYKGTFIGVKFLFWSFGFVTKKILYISMFNTPRISVLYVYEKNFTNRLCQFSLLDFGFAGSISKAIGFALLKRIDKN